jgi:hypothetical protein
LGSAAPTVDGNDLSMMKQAIKDGAGCRNIVEQFAPFFDGPVGRHHGGAVFITTHNDLQEDFTAFLRQNLRPISSTNVELHIYRIMLSYQKCGVASSDLGRKRFAVVLHSTLLMRGSERFQPSDEIGIARHFPKRRIPLSCGFAFRGDRGTNPLIHVVCFLQSIHDESAFDSTVSCCRKARDRQDRSV